MHARAVGRDTWVHGHTEDGTEVPPTRLPGYETDVLTDKLIDVVRRRKADGRPFFAAMSAQPPHNPYVAPEVRARPLRTPLASVQNKNKNKKLHNLLFHFLILVNKKKSQKILVKKKKKK